MLKFEKNVLATSAKKENVQLAPGGCCCCCCCCCVSVGINGGTATSTVPNLGK